MIATKEDYLIKGVNGELYPCKKDIFEKTYISVQFSTITNYVLYS